VPDFAPDPHGLSTIADSEPHCPFAQIVERAAAAALFLVGGTARKERAVLNDSITPADCDPLGSFRIDIDRDQEMHYWTRVLRVDERTLKEAIRRVGPLEREIRRFLVGE
jgi:hypothetical protein